MPMNLFTAGAKGETSKPKPALFLIAYVRDQCAKCYGKSVWPGSLNDRHYQGGAGLGRQ